MVWVADLFEFGTQGNSTYMLASVAVLHRYAITCVSSPRVRSAMLPINKCLDKLIFHSYLDSAICIGNVQIRCFSTCAPIWLRCHPCNFENLPTFCLRFPSFVRHSKGPIRCCGGFCCSVSDGKQRHQSRWLSFHSDDEQVCYDVSMRFVLHFRGCSAMPTLERLPTSCLRFPYFLRNQMNTAGHGCHFSGYRMLSPISIKVIITEWDIFAGTNKKFDRDRISVYNNMEIAWLSNHFSGFFSSLLNADYLCIDCHCAEMATHLPISSSYSHNEEKRGSIPSVGSIGSSVPDLLNRLEAVL